RTRSEGDLQGYDAAEDDVVLVGRRVVAKLDVAEPPGQRPEGDLTLGSGQRGAEAVVDAEAERQVAVVGPPDVEALRIGELGGIAVGGREEQDRLLVLRNGAAGHLDVLEHDPTVDLDRRVEAEALLDGRSGQRRVVREPGEPRVGGGRGGR